MKGHSRLDYPQTNKISSHPSHSVSMGEVSFPALTLSWATWLALTNETLADGHISRDTKCTRGLLLDTCVLPLTWEEHSLNSHCPFSLCPETRSVKQRCPQRSAHRSVSIHLRVFCNTAITDWYRGPTCPRPLLRVCPGNLKIHSIPEGGGAWGTGKYCFWGFRTPVVGWRKR